MERNEPFVYEFYAENEEYTERLARELAPHLQKGMVITLDGGLGAGKTKFVQGLAQAIGVSEIVNSPTFTLIKEYEGEHLWMFHMDMYRVTLQEAYDLGLNEYLYGEGITLIEWACQITPLLPEQRLSIDITYIDLHQRRFQLTPYGDAYFVVCEQLQKNGILL